MSRQHWIAAVIAVAGVLLLAQGLYIPAKAVLAQVLLDHAWARSQQGEQQVRPWSWADTWPVARIRQPRLGIDQVVLEGASGRVLAFGPGHVGGSAKPGGAGNAVLSGHRDTHFAWLAQLRDNDLVELELRNGQQLRYVVVRRAVHHAKETALLDRWQFDGLRLITCYPFDSLSPGTDRRFVVDAVLM